MNRTTAPIQQTASTQPSQQVPRPPVAAAVSAPASASASTAVASTASAAADMIDGHRLPEPATLLHAVKLAIIEDKQIMMDYWTQSIEKTVLIGVRENKEKLLVKSEEEYTSPIAKIYKLGNEFVIVTENSIYIVDIGIPTKRISS